MTVIPFLTTIFARYSRAKLSRSQMKPIWSCPSIFLGGVDGFPKVFDCFEDVTLFLVITGVEEETSLPRREGTESLPIRSGPIYSGTPGYVDGVLYGLARGGDTCASEAPRQFWR
jgi:hypothetical protein